MNPKDLKYSKEHEWVRIEKDGTTTIGITAFAADQLGDVVYVDLPEVGSTVQQFAKFGEVESVKAVSDIYSPVSGTVTARNEAIVKTPESVNSAPFEGGWLVKVKLANKGELDTLLTSDQYDKFLAAQ
ncbi:MAG: glycine cleavage system protein GcvH [SAR202 cluster bacterium]|nr:glycine cleavage system protein GcvH [SAR202 cluster bacterium]